MPSYNNARLVVSSPFSLRLRRGLNHLHCHITKNSLDSLDWPVWLEVGSASLFFTASCAYRTLNRSVGIWPLQKNQSVRECKSYAIKLYLRNTKRMLFVQSQMHYVDTCRALAYHCLYMTCRIHMSRLHATFKCLRLFTERR